MNAVQAEAFGHNDLQPVAEALCPAISRVARWLEDRFGNSRMTGSGSAVFAEVDRRIGEPDVREGGGAGHEPAATRPPGQAHDVPEARELRDLPEGWVGRLCRSLAHHPLRDWAG